MEQHQQPFCPPGRGCSSALGRTRHCLKGSDESFWCKHPARPFLQHRSSVFRPRPASWLLHFGTGTATGVTPAGNWARDGGTGGVLGLHPGVLLDEASWCARGNCGKFPPLLHLWHCCMAMWFLATSMVHSYQNFLWCNFVPIAALLDQHPAAALSPAAPRPLCLSWTDPALHCVGVLRRMHIKYKLTGRGCFVRKSSPQHK